MENTKIEWATHTFNPWMGCTKVSPGCANCYAETLMDTRWNKVKWGKGQPRVRTGAKNWQAPRRWDYEAGVAGVRARVFCASLADWLDDEVEAQWRADLLCLVRETPHLDWLLLTKRPQNFERLLGDLAAFREVGSEQFRWELCWSMGQPPENVWIGTSAEDQERWDVRLPALIQIPAKVNFVSAEPLLGPITMGELRPDWLIVGGESGPGARPMESGWVESLRDQCGDPGRPVAFHFKQWGGVDKARAGRLLEGRTWDELPVVK